MIVASKHIEIVSSSLPGLSSMSHESREAILYVLSKHYSRVGITIVNSVSDLERLVKMKPNLVFLGMKFLPLNPELGFHDTERIWLSDYLDENGITYTGSGQSAHKLELDKPLAKQRVLDIGLKTSPFYVVKRRGSIAKPHAKLNYPLFVKPSDRGGGIGVDSESVVRSEDKLQSKITSITKNFDSDSLVEEYLPGREFSVAILRDKFEDSPLVMPIELIAEPDSRGARMLSSEIKSTNAEEVIELTDNALRHEVCELALGVFHALGANDYGRIDIRLDQYGEPHFLEANLMPSLIDGYGSFPKACMLNVGLNYENMLLKIVSLAFAGDEIEPAQAQRAAGLLLATKPV